MALLAIKDGQNVRGAAESQGIHEGQLHRIFSNRFYIGEVPYDKDGERVLVRGRHEPLVDITLLEAAKRNKPGRIGVPRLLTKDLVRNTIELRRQGWTMQQIADHLGVSYATIQRTFRRDATKKVVGEKDFNAALRVSVSAKTRLWKKHRADISQRLQDQGSKTTAKEIAESLGMKLATVQKHLKELWRDHEIRRTAGPRRAFYYETEAGHLGAQESTALARVDKATTASTQATK
jgi:DNA-binding MarR family transcriptional regulator